MRLFEVRTGLLFLNTNNLPRRFIVTLATLLFVWPAVSQGYRIFRGDCIIRNDPTIKGYTRALQHDPGNATLWWLRGRLHHYSVSPDIREAISDYRKALSLNPRLSQAWLDLADCQERNQKYDEAEAALNNALLTHAYSPKTHWQAGNFFLRRGSLRRMYDNFKLAVQYDSGKLGIATLTAWKADSDHPGILQRLVPDRLSANMRYLDFLVSQEELDLARAAWDRVIKDEAFVDSEFKIALSFRYIDRLLAANRVAEAERIWDEALRKIGRLPDRRIVEKADSERLGHVNLVRNGSFEEEMLRGGLDWRFPDVPDVQFEADLNNCLDGLKCLRVVFGGANTKLSKFSQVVPVPGPGTYVLDFSFRTENLTTDQRPYLYIQGYPEASGAKLRTDPFPESSGWTKTCYRFLVQENCRAVQLTLRRDPSFKFDNLIKGSLWLDAVSITPSLPLP